MENGREITAEQVVVLVKAECDNAIYIPLRQALIPYQVRPFVRLLRWPYGAGNPEFPCWIIADLSPNRSNLMLAYSEFGYGSRDDCWGIIGTDDQWYGRDDSWFLRLEDAFINAGMWPEPLPDNYETL